MRRRERPAHWRVEADERWLAAHSSEVFGRVRKLLSHVGLGTVGDAVSHAELGPFGGAPRKPVLKPGVKPYSTERPADKLYGHTVLATVLADRPRRCRRCARELAVTQRVTCVREDGAPVVVGTVPLCHPCQRDSWQFVSRMPRTARARDRSRGVVL